MSETNTSKLYWGLLGPQPTLASPSAVVFHSLAELDAMIESGQRNVKTHGEFVDGILVDVTRDRTTVTAVPSPPYSARLIANPGKCLHWAVEQEGFVADHLFVRREPLPEDLSGGVVKSIYATCQGCYDKGWHRPEAEVRCIAFGVEEPPRPSAEAVEAARRRHAEHPGVNHRLTCNALYASSHA